MLQFHEIFKKKFIFCNFFSQLEKSDDGFAIVAEYFGRGMFRKQYDVDDTAAKALEGIKLKKNPIVENVQPKSDKRYSPKLTEKHPAVSINISKKKCTLQLLDRSLRSNTITTLCLSSHNYISLTSMSLFLF